MSRTYVDCREVPSESNCSVAIVADTPEELMEAAVQHAVSVHHHEDSPELRSEIRKAFKEGNPPLEPPAMHWQQASQPQNYANPT